MVKERQLETSYLKKETVDPSTRTWSGSGYLKADGPFQIVAMKKQVQTSNMHQRRFRERERFSNKSSQALPECIIPALYMICLTCFLAHCCMLLFWNNCLICSPKI